MSYHAVPSLPFHPQLLSGDEAVALAAVAAGVALTTGYPGTPSTEIPEAVDALGGRAQWAPNEKVALEVALGVAFAGARALCTMKHVGLNVASDVLFTAAYSGVSGALVIVSADDPGMHSSQNEQDNRRFALAAGVPLLEPSDAQECYDFTLAALALSERWRLPVLLRLTTRVCHSRSLVRPTPPTDVPPTPKLEISIPTRVMIPAHAKPAHRRLRAKLAEIAEFGESSDLNQIVPGEPELGIVCSGVSYLHVREAAPEAVVLKLGLTHPLPAQLLKRFVAGVRRCVVIEEGDPYLVEQLRYLGLEVEDKPAAYRFGELNVGRVRRILRGDTSPEPAPVPGTPPRLCDGCPHRVAYTVLKERGCFVAGDIGCYTLGALPPFQALHTQICMGASIGVGLGLRHVLPDAEARTVVSVIGDSTFVHSGLTGLVEMVYNPPPTGHVVVLLDNGTTAMTGLQEHPGTGRRLGHEATHKLHFEDLARAVGVDHVHTIDAAADPEGFGRLLDASLANGQTNLLIVRRPCLLAARKLKQLAQAAEPTQECAHE